jgi:hypothetical protein
MKLCPLCDGKMEPLKSVPPKNYCHSCKQSFAEPQDPTGERFERLVADRLLRDNHTLDVLGYYQGAPLYGSIFPLNDEPRPKVYSHLVAEDIDEKTGVWPDRAQGGRRHFVIYPKPEPPRCSDCKGSLSDGGATISLGGRCRACAAAFHRQAAKEAAGAAKCREGKHRWDRWKRSGGRFDSRGSVSSTYTRWCSRCRDYEEMTLSDRA